MTRSEYRDFVRRARRRHSEAALSIIFGWVLLLTVIMFLGSFADRLIHGGLEWKDLIRACTWSYMLVLGVYAVTSPGLSHDTMVQELLTEGRCVSCAFDLRGLPIDENNLTRCPECEARWRIAPSQPTA